MRPIARAVAVFAVAATAGALAPPTELQFPRLNATYRDLAPELMPVSSAGMTIYLSSPANSLTIRGHHLELEPLGGPRHRFRGWVDILGKADLVAELAGAPGRMQDQVLLPSQRVELAGEVDIVPSPEGYDITTRQLPTHAEIAMQSRLGNQLLSICDTMTLFTGGDCSGIGAAFSRVRVPLPPPGETYLLPTADLTAEERALLDGYLSGVAAAPR